LRFKDFKQPIERALYHLVNPTKEIIGKLTPNLLVERLVISLGFLLLASTRMVTDKKGIIQEHHTELDKKKVQKGGMQGIIMVPFFKHEITLIVEEILVPVALLAVFTMPAHHNATI
jgi:hypothetical protein